jgi:hypothetical protein
MKKLSVHLSLLCLLALLLIPFAGCKKEETTEETPATTEMETTTEPMSTDMGTTSTDMGTDMTTSEPMGTDMQPPAGQ